MLEYRTSTYVWKMKISFYSFEGDKIPMRKKMCKEYQISGMPRLEIPTQLTIGGPPPCTVPQPHPSAYL